MQQVKGYAFSQVLDTDYDQALSMVRTALGGQGFGVLTEIDVQATLRKKLGESFRKYTILGACNPPFALRALKTDLDVGLLLPCNVIVYETDDQKIMVAAINPVSALSALETPMLRDLAAQVSDKLRLAMESLNSPDLGSGGGLNAVN
jgi:uncharacterized protein (DUF302 family)